MVNVLGSKVLSAPWRPQQSQEGQVVRCLDHGDTGIEVEHAERNDATETTRTLSGVSSKNAKRRTVMMRKSERTHILRKQSFRQGRPARRGNRATLGEGHCRCFRGSRAKDSGALLCAEGAGLLRRFQANLPPCDVPLEE